MSMKKTSTSQQVAVEITKPAIKRLDESNQWIGFLPTEQNQKFRCQSQEELQKLIRTFMLEISDGCEMSTNQEKFTNEKTVCFSQPMLFSDLESSMKPTAKVNLTFCLDEIDLDDLQVIHSHPHLSEWIIIIYLLLLVAFAYLCMSVSQYFVLVRFTSCLNTNCNFQVWITLFFDRFSIFSTFNKTKKWQKDKK